MYVIIFAFTLQQTPDNVFHFLLCLCVWSSCECHHQNEDIKIAVEGGEDFSHHDDCAIDYYAEGLTPTPLPALNLSHLPVWDRFLEEPIYCA